MNGSARRQILLGVTASIAAPKACDLVEELSKAGFEVTAAMTRDARRFITPLTLRTLTNKEVAGDLFDDHPRPIHTELANRADAILIAPATADFIAKLAHGFADDVLSCAVLASEAPIVVAPAMNDKMLRNPFTQENLERLRRRGMTVVAPVVGRLACGYEAEGHIAPAAAILAAVRAALAGSDAAR